MNHLTIEQLNECEDVLLDLRLLVYDDGIYIRMCEDKLKNPFNEITAYQRSMLTKGLKSTLAFRKQLGGYIEDIVTLMKSPVSLENLIFGYLYRLLSFRIV